MAPGRSGWGLYLKDIVPFLGLLAMIGSLRSAVADWNQVPTGSMRPTILEGDRIFVNKLAYDLKIPFTSHRLVSWGRPERGDIIVFYSPFDGTRLVKRVVGVPGDEIELRDNHLVVNGLPASYEPIDPTLMRGIQEVQRGSNHASIESVPGASYPVMTLNHATGYGSFRAGPLPVGYYFAMGDNRDNSADSRVFGPVPMDLIVGRATAVVVSIPPDGDEVIRRDRIFESLR